MTLPPIDFAEPDAPDPWSPGRRDSDPVEEGGPVPEGRRPRARHTRHTRHARKPRHLLRKALVVAVVLVVAATVGFGVWCEETSYAPTGEAVAAARSGTETAEGWLTFGDPDAKCGLVFYPGALVEPDAYAPLLELLAAQDVFCVLVDMPLNLAFFDIGAAGDVQSRYPEVERWYLAGHSLGGAMAASYIAGDANAWEGLVLLAAYSTADLTDTDLDVLTIVGSNDGVVNRDKLESCAANLPAGAREEVIEGGNHAGFGSYGVQEGDGTADISVNAQQRETAQLISELMGLSYPAGYKEWSATFGAGQTTGAGEAGREMGDRIGDLWEARLSAAAV